MRKIPFVKYTMLGNKFSIVDETPNPVLSESRKSSFAYRATDNYYGVGADNFLVIQPSSSEVLGQINEVRRYWEKPPDPDGADYVFRMFEPDGTEAFSCGNGLMCVSDYLHRRYGVDSARIMTQIPTPAPKILEIGTDSQKKMSWSNMGSPGTIPREMANLPAALPHDGPMEEMKNIDIRFSGNGFGAFEKNAPLTLSGHLVFTGEPHLVVSADTGFSSENLADRLFRKTLGGKSMNAKNDPASRMIHHIGMSVNKDFPDHFPAGLNISFMHILPDRKSIEYRCFERGINRETWACGTGAVAAAFVARHLNRLDAAETELRPYVSRLHDPDAHIRVREEHGDYILYGRPLLLFEGDFFVRKGFGNDVC